MDLLGIRLIGVDPETGRKLLITAVFFVAILAVRWLVVGAVWLGTGRRGKNSPPVFWTRQATSVLALVLCALVAISIWLASGHTATAVGLVTAGLAVALQKVWTALGGYFLILRGKTFSVGDRITMGGVRGDVISLGFLQTRILEMGQPPPVQEAPPATWVTARQYTGRIVSVTNDAVFNQPVYNLSREFPYLFEEISIPIKYGTDRQRAERILLEAARPATEEIRRAGEERLRELSERYGVPDDEIVPRVYYRLTDNWLEMTIRFLVPDHSIRKIKDQIAREILNAFEAAGLEIASGTYDIVGLPPLRLQLERQEPVPPSHPEHPSH